MLLNSIFWTWPGQFPSELIATVSTRLIWPFTFPSFKGVGLMKPHPSLRDTSWWLEKRWWVTFFRSVSIDESSISSKQRLPQVPIGNLNSTRWVSHTYKDKKVARYFLGRRVSVENGGLRARKRE